jgi:hypothetical protein
VRTGLNLKFQSKPQLKERIEEVMYEGEKRKAMAKWMREMLRERHIMKVPEEEEVARPTMFWIRSFLTWSSSQWRQVFDLKELNSHLVVPTFSQESLRGVSKKISRMQWAFKADASKMFWHIAVDPKWRPFLQFRYRGATYECASMPLGLATAPFICQQLMSRLHKYLWDKGINAIFYVDDWLILGDNKPKTALMAQLFVTEMANFGIHLNLKKTMTAPSQRFAFLGINFDLAKRRIMVPTEKLRDLERAASRLLDRECVSARELQSFLGKTNFVAIATVFAKLKTDAVMRWKNKLWRETKSWDAKEELPDRVVKELLWWRSLKKEVMRRELRNDEEERRDPDGVELETDAGPRGWGARWRVVRREREWRVQWGEFSRMLKSGSSNIRELTVLLYVLRRRGREWKRRVVTWTTDSVVAASYVRRVYGSAAHLSWTSAKIHSLLWKWKIRLRIVVVKGEEIQEVDRLSRLV